LDIRVLGPVEVTGPHGRADLQGPRRRAVFGVLALHAGTVIPRERLVDVLWDDDPPRTAVKSLHSHVARVRQALRGCGLPDVLHTSNAGYLLDVDAEVVDAHRFERCVRSVGERGDDPDGVVARCREALALWRGDGFDDAMLTGWGVAELNRLRELRLTAWEHLWDAELRRGRHSSVIVDLERSLVAHPHRERLVGLYMLALYRCGRQVDALDAYQRLRQRLADDLGVDPAPELIALYAEILRHDARLDLPKPARRAPVPAQLPARPGHFTGRRAELDTLDAALAGPEPPIVMISGPAGMGKTALAVQWAHRVADRFPDGQLFLDLRGHDQDTALPAAEALSQLLIGLDVPADRVPTAPLELANLYRSLLHGKRFLIVLDNCGDTEDLLGLVPGSATNLLVVTSRKVPGALAVRHAVCGIGLHAFDTGTALALLTRVLGQARVDREPDDAARLAQLCGGMPLALRIAAAKLLVQPDSGVHGIHDLVVELAGADRLESLSVPRDSRSVLAVFASAYRTLTQPAARMFRLLGQFPGMTITPELAAAVCGLPAAAAKSIVDELAVTQMITALPGGRYRFHDLIRLFAHQCGRNEPDRAEATERMLDWYLGLAEAANEMLDPTRDRIRPTLRYPAELPADPLAFLDAAPGDLVSVVRQAGQHGLPATWQLVGALTSFFYAKGHWAERIEMCRAAALAAHRVGDAGAEAEMLRSLGVAYRVSRRMAEALEVYPRALELMRATGDQRGQAAVYNSIGAATVELRRFDEAVAAYEQAIAMHSAAGNRWGVLTAQRNLGYTYVRMGRPELSHAPLREALGSAREIDNPRMEAATLDTLGEALLHQGDAELALEYFRRALDIGRTIGDRRFESETLNNIGLTQLELGNPAAALGSLRQALTVCRGQADQHGESLVLNNIGKARLVLGDVAGAREELRLALVIRERIPDSYEESQLRQTLAELDARSLAGENVHLDPAVADRAG
jgi:DNA-binding SARP family transcriptional activator/tetratricopeptide (TPR) repeat protein